MFGRTLCQHEAPTSGNFNATLGLSIPVKTPQKTQIDVEGAKHLRVIVAPGMSPFDSEVVMDMLRLPTAPVDTDGNPVRGEKTHGPRSIGLIMPDKTDPSAKRCLLLRGQRNGPVCGGVECIRHEVNARTTQSLQLLNAIRLRGEIEIV